MDVKAFDLDRVNRGIPLDLRSKLLEGELERSGVEKVFDIMSLIIYRFKISSSK